MRRRRVYLDNAATTAVDPAVARLMADCLGREAAEANPSSAHDAGREALELIETARAQVAARVGAKPEEIVFTSGATEANNLALRGVLAAERHGAGHLITTRIEHASVLDTARALGDTGIDLSLLDCDPQGRVAVEDIAAALRGDTALVSVMHVNNEIGVVQAIADIAALCRARGVLLHVDAAQSAGKLMLELDAWGIDLCSLSAHKLHGPKGVGALFIREGLHLAPLMHGGGQERGLRPGTLATHQIAGMGKAYELADPARDGVRLQALRAALWEGLAAIDGVRLNGCPERAAPHILSVSFAGVEGESLRFALRDLVVSQGSACASQVDEPSHVLSSLGLGDALAQSTLRLSVGRFTTPEDVAYAVERIASQVERLRRLADSAPAWCRSL